ncbi:MAG TPA: bifunctional serine/threonine-protein kinase/formylglycine-generating enzyme family protein [Planctomicrobium sp.]|nr:bifunctional serine/threonine-protein kinase/formylglycine-generating enzyme family protein [Planctomicrobium sp.]
MADERLHLENAPQEKCDLEVVLQIDSICDAFESSWKEGSRPDLNDYLQATNLPLNTLFVELVLVDVSYRQKQGENPTLQEYAERFPHLQEALSGLTIPALPDVGATVSVNSDLNPRVGKFELVEKLGAGAFGIVWKGWDQQLHRWVALKQFREEYSGVSHKLLTREATAVAQIDHPNVVRVYEIGQHAGQAYVAFEYVPGGTLSQWMKRQPATCEKIQIPPQESAEIALQLAKGLGAVHACNVIHRDFKPGNILLDEKGTLKIADFGLAHHASLLATIGGDGILMGTVPYMSPEQCRGKEVTVRSDIYSLGVVLYELLTGQLPFQGSQPELLEGIQNHQPPRPGKLADVPISLENICLRMLEKEPDDRYQTAAELQADLEAFLRGESVSRSVPSLWMKLQRTIRRNSLTAVSVGIMMTGLSVLAYSAVNAPDDGKKIVKLTSVPEGAKVAFIPLDRLTGVPQPEKIIHARGTTPISERLLPGNYLVEVYLEDGSGDFHEVYRRVPTDDEKLSTHEAYLNWQRDKDNFDVVTLMRVKIPSKSVVDEMVMVPGSDRFQVGKEGSPMIPAHWRSMPAFYMDPTEVPLSVYQKTFNKAGDPDKRWQRPLTPDHAMTTKWPMAVFLLEQLGKRLPDEFEYELAATKNGTQRFSWGNDPRSVEPDEIAFEPVGFPRFDRVDYDAPIYGLGSNVAEWTMSRSVATYPSIAEELQGVIGSISDLSLRIIRGGSPEVIDGHPTVNAMQRDPRMRASEPFMTIKSGLGFRGVRSPRPRLKPEDFGQILEPQ